MFIYISFLPYSGMAFYPFIILKERKLSNEQVLVNHEKIHLKQQLELLIVPFYFLYLLNYVVNVVRFRKHDKAYRQIIFEREAYSNEKDLAYLKQRKFWNFIKYL